jgi:magnesium chelatase family protein
MSGPLLDRIDMQVEVPAVKPGQLLAEADGESSTALAARVSAARQRQVQRQGLPNAAIEAGRIDALCRLDDTAARFLQVAAQRLAWSGRSLHRALKVARTIADLADAQYIGSAHAAEAMQYRRSLIRSVHELMKPRLRLATSKFARLGNTPSSWLSDRPNQRPSVAPS